MLYMLSMLGTFQIETSRARAERPYIAVVSGFTWIGLCPGCLLFHRDVYLQHGSRSGVSRALSRKLDAL